MADEDDKGFTTYERFNQKYERQRQKVERMEEDFLEQLKNAFRDNKSRLARDFLQYRNENPYGGKATPPKELWGGPASDYTGFGADGGEDDE